MSTNVSEFGLPTSQCNICSYTRHSRPISESHPTFLFSTSQSDEELTDGGGEGGVCLVTSFLSCIHCFYQIYPCYSSCLDHMIHPQFHTKGELCSYGESTGNIYVKIILVVGPLSGVECSGVGVHKSSFLCSISIKRLKRREKRDRPSPPPLEEKLCLPCALLLTHKSSSCAVQLIMSHILSVLRSYFKSARATLGGGG